LKLKGVKRMYSLQGAYPREDKTKIKKRKKKVRVPWHNLPGWGK